jgi:organic radical activating enzyme
VRNLSETLRLLISPSKPLPPGIYHYIAPHGDSSAYRLHLRLEPDGTGILSVNASTILHLNQTAAEYAYHLVRRTTDETTARLVSGRYKVSPQQALQDYRDFKERIELLLMTADLDPEIFLDMERSKQQALSAPLRLDCALTYRLPQGVDPSFAPIDRVIQELSTDEWKAIIDKAWAVGIPHIIFTGGEATLREDLPELILHAEKNGQVTGLLSDGTKFKENAYFETLLQSGLDHLLFLLHPESDASWDALSISLAADLFVTTHLTVTPYNLASVPVWLEKIKGLGAQIISLSTSDLNLQDQLISTMNRAAELDLKLVWNLPVPFSALNPVALEIGSENQDNMPSTVYVEPDGDVRLAQDHPHLLGNLFTHNWETIWSGVARQPAQS